jgi:hypothetical protein
MQLDRRHLNLLSQFQIDWSASVSPQINGPHTKHCGPRYLSRYSDSLRAGRSGDRISVGARFSAPVHTGPGAHPASYTMGTGSFPRVKRPGRGVNHPPPSSAEVKERVDLYLYSTSGPSWPLIGRTLPF